MSKRTIATLAALLAALALLAMPRSGAAERRLQHPPAAPLPEAGSLVDAALRDSFTDARLPEPKAAWRSRFRQDDIMQLCSRYQGRPPRRVAAAIARLAGSSIVYPADGVLIGDWRRGETIAQSGYGRRTTDTDASRPNGGNCYACHQLDPKEASHGTLGPNLAGYGRIKDFSEAAARKVYDHIYNPHAHTPCSGMPRFGAGSTLTIEQIKDLVALVMSRDSPVNK